MAESTNEEPTSTRRKVLQPVKIREILNESDWPKKIEQASSVRKRIEPMKIKDLMKSLSARKKPEPVRVPLSSKSAKRADVNVPVPRQNAKTPGSYGKNVRRKLYTTQNTPQELNLKTKLLSIPKNQEAQQPAKLTISAKNVNHQKQTSRKSSLLPPNSIREYYVRKRLSKGTIFEASCKDASVQTHNEPVQETTSKKSNFSRSTNQYTNDSSSGVLTSSQLSTVNKLICNVGSITNIRSINNECENPLPESSTTSGSCAADTIDNRLIETENFSGQSQFQGPSVIIEGGYSFHPQPLHENQILLQIPNDTENPRITQRVPIINSNCVLESEHVIVERNNLLSIEAYLKEGIVNMTQALNLVQATLYSNSFSSQTHSTLPFQQKISVYDSRIPVNENFSSPISETIELTDIKIEPTFGDTSPPTVFLPLTPAISEIENNNEATRGDDGGCGGGGGGGGGGYDDDDNDDDSREPKQLKSLRVRLENCLLNTPKETMAEKSKGQISKLKETSPRIHNFVPTLSDKLLRNDKSQSNLPIISRTEMNPLQTPNRTSMNLDDNLLKTPNTKNKNILMTPRKQQDDNKENFQTPMSRRKTFSGLDSQKIRRSVRIARHHLRQSLGDDSFLALERELNIVYPQTNI